MNREQLWAPWRMAYIQGDRAQPTPADLPWRPGADRECFLCRAAAIPTDRDAWVIRRSAHCVAVLNRYPYNNGHILVAPLDHLAHLQELSPTTQNDSLAMLTQLVCDIERLMQAQGFNLGLNLGRAAGAGVPGHLHWHLVPRWTGDTNFMGVVAGVDVIPQALDSLWELLHQPFATSPA